MKNIHLIPTDKPSRLHLTNSELVLCDLNFGKNTINSQHIYITSDEEIKEGDWIIWNKKIVKAIDTAYHSAKKIILTTDPDLIKDGVQSIDDEFLEWFVKNPSCEFIEYVGDDCYYEIIIPQEETKNPNNQEVMFHEERKEYFHEDIVDGKLVTVWLGKDYIPKEEPKQTDWKESTKLLMEAYGDDPKDFPYEEPKQETLEEFPIYSFMSIEPSTKKQQKELENNRIRLGIKNKEEDFVLKCLLSFDWKREVILYEVEKVSFTGNMIDFRVRVKAPNKIVDYCCSNPFKETGWSLERPDFKSRAWEVWSQLSKYIKK